MDAIRAEACQNAQDAFGAILDSETCVSAQGRDVPILPETGEGWCRAVPLVEDRLITNPLAWEAGTAQRRRRATRLLSQPAGEGSRPPHPAMGQAHLRSCR